MTPQIGTVVDESLRGGSLEVVAGRTCGLRLAADGLAVSLAIRGSGETKTPTAGRVINGTGPETDLSRRAKPVLRNLMEQGWLQPGA
jgi:uncharacterized NAD(P)/FAD-binding protein YdhS